MSEQHDHFEDLSRPWRVLIRTMQSMNYGRIENLPIIAGEPRQDDRVTIVTEYKIGGTNGPREDAMQDAFTLKKQVIELIEMFARIENGVVHRLVVKNGLPFSFEMEES